MTTIVRAKPTEIRWNLAAWLPLAVLPVAAGALTADWPAWVRMWLLAFSIYASLKWLTFAVSPAARQATLGQSAGYLLLWTGMDAEAFFGKSPRTEQPRWTEWTWATGQMAAGAWLLVRLAPRLAVSHPLVAGWVAMTGLVSVLHFGVSQLLSLGWRAAGTSAQHIMHKPVFARSLADFWGRRWNLAFRDLAHRFVFQPLIGRVGPAWAMTAVFFVSGLVHDAVISVAARAGWGLPTLYFLIQAGAALVERSRMGRRVGLGRGTVGWMFAAAVIVGPVGLLFHSPFLTHVVAPMVEAIGRTTS
jgi:hypothetical protein